MLRIGACQAAGSGSGPDRQRAEQLDRLEDGAPIAVGGAHLQADRGLARIGAEPFEPACGIQDGLFDRVVEAVEVGVGLGEGVNQPVGLGGVLAG